MRLFQDIQSKPLLHAKGLLFLLVGLLAAGAILLESPRMQTFLLLLITIWAFCRFYYYLFYVLENYAGRDRKYAGLFDALKFIFSPKNRR
ncbi:MAG: hypothetical protein K0R17_3007 [Rariglobus sp.]|jgi:hypothetical protein|nr:hypothetical protein [Rariglobus sp.]